MTRSLDDALTNKSRSALVTEVLTSLLTHNTVYYTISTAISRIMQSGSVVVTVIDLSMQLPIVIGAVTAYVIVKRSPGPVSAVSVTKFTLFKGF